VDEAQARLDIIVEALDAAAVALERARARNVPRSGLPRPLRWLGPLGGSALEVYNRLFIVQREIAADQNEALVALVNATRELARLQRVTHLSGE
jgi:hypothetical protein